MLSKEEIRKTLEGVMTSEAYKQANDVMSLLYATIKYLDSLSTDVKFRDEYNNTRIFYHTVAQAFELVIDKYNTGDIILALQSLKQILVDTHGNLKIQRETLKKGESLFRMRAKDGYNLYKREEMFHIPTDKIRYVQNYRYSLNGFPCLYLGTSLYVCWEETRRPDIDKVNYVKMVATKDIRVVTTLCPSSFKDIDDVIQFFVFALCTKMASNDNDKFQFQYAIPELLLHLLVNCMQSGDEAWGIKYVSARYFENDGKFTTEPIFYNYVLPKRDPVDSKDHLSKELKSAFKVSEVKASYVRRVYEKSMTFVPRTRPNEYANTYFKILENDLKAIKCL